MKLHRRSFLSLQALAVPGLVFGGATLASAGTPSDAVLTTLEQWAGSRSGVSVRRSILSEKDYGITFSGPQQLQDELAALIAQFPEGPRAKGSSFDLAHAGRSFRLAVRFHG